MLEAAWKIGVEGVLVTDAIDEEAAEISKIFLAKENIDLISLISPTTTDARLKTICDNASGFVYAVSRAGVTGARSDTSAAAGTLVSQCEKIHRSAYCCRIRYIYSRANSRRLAAC